MKKTLFVFLSLFFAAGVYAVDDEVKVDQLGYRILSPKCAIVAMDKAAYFRVMTAKDNREVFTGALKGPIKDYDSGDNCYTADFSDFTGEGSFYLEVDREFKSYNFTIENDVYNKAFYKSMRGFYLQRCGTKVKDPGGWQHDACHLKPALFHVTAGKGLNTSKDATGGWHDAGDFGRYVVNSGLSTATLLYMFERFKGKLGAYKMDIPQGPFKLPDILEEIKYNLDWMFKMQREDGAVYHKVTPLMFPGFIMPEKDTGQEYIFEVTSCATADFAAVMAIAARVYAPYSKVFSDKCISSAKRAWEFLKPHPDIVPPGGFKNPSDCKTGQYADGTDSDERFWAAVELYNSTADQEYGDYVDSAIGNYSPTVVAASSWSDLQSAAMISYCYTANPAKNAKTDEMIRTDLRRHANVLLARVNETGYRMTMKEEDYIWGSNAVVLNYAINLISAGELCNDKTYIQGAEEALHYIFGRNPFNMSFVTGLGTSSVMRIHHRPSAADENPDPWPGLLAGGPNKGRQDRILMGLPFDTPAMKCYEDNMNSYASNEIAINWNAPLCYVLAYFMQAAVK